MKVYLVGGAVRDQLLGLPVSERDWVVVGGTASELLDKGYKQVGNDFPVFLHPLNGEEYALARTERKSGSGYGGFEFDSSANVTLEQDLQRRDLTINAIAQDDDGQLIDPWGGLADLQARRLRHVSSAFVEDPLRVLRVARFAAKLKPLDFTIDPATEALMSQIAKSGELVALSPERIWRELEKGLAQRAPDCFIETLYRCGALASIAPALDKQFHRSDGLLDDEQTVGQRTLGALRYAAERGFDGTVRWTIVAHGIAPAGTPKNLAAKVIQPVDSSSCPVAALGEQLKASRTATELAQLAAHYTGFALRAGQSRPDLLLKLLEHTDAWRRGERFKQFMQVAEAIANTAASDSAAMLGSLGLLRHAADLGARIDASEFVEQGLKGSEIGEAIRNARKILLADLLKQFSNP